MTAKYVVIDNSKYMEQMRDKLKARHKYVYGCLTCWLRLLGQDITPVVIMKHMTEVQIYFCKLHRHSAWLKNRCCGVNPQLITWGNKVE